MFKLNSMQITKKGEVVKPYTVQGDMVYCFDRGGNSIIRHLEDFNFNKIIEKKTISVMPKLNKDLKTDSKPVEVPENIPQPAIEAPAPTQTQDTTETTQPVSSSSTQPSTDNTTSQDNTNITNQSSIWDTVNAGEDYI